MGRGSGGGGRVGGGRVAGGAASGERVANTVIDGRRVNLASLSDNEVSGLLTRLYSEDPRMGRAVMGSIQREANIRREARRAAERLAEGAIPRSEWNQIVAMTTGRRASRSQRGRL